MNLMYHGSTKFSRSTRRTSPKESTCKLQLYLARYISELGQGVLRARLLAPPAVHVTSCTLYGVPHVKNGRRVETRFGTSQSFCTKGGSTYEMLSTRTYLLILLILLLDTSGNFEIYWYYFQWNRGRGPGRGLQLAQIDKFSTSVMYLKGS